MTKGFLWWKKVAVTICSAHMVYDKNCKLCNDTLFWVPYTKEHKREMKETKKHMEEYQRKNKSTLNSIISHDGEKW